MTARKQARLVGAVAYGVMALISIVALELRLDSQLTDNPLALVPYVSVVALAAILGARFSSWYFPQTGVFEIVAVPVIVMLGAALVSGISYSIASLIALPSNVSSVSELFGSALFMTLIYLAAGWPVLLLGSLAISVAMSAKYRHASQFDAV